MSHDPTGVRLIIYHKHNSSAMTRFLRHANGGMTGFDPIPKLSQLIEKQDEKRSEEVVPHPSLAITRAAEVLGLNTDVIELDGEFLEKIDIPGGVQSVYLARITTIDPPFENVEKKGAKFVCLTEVHSVLPVELDLLRIAYCRIMG